MQANPLEDRALGHTEPCMRRPVVAAPWRGEQAFSTCVLGPLDTSSSSSDAEDAARDVIVTAASTSHRHALASFVEFYLRCNLSHRLVVYDLGGGGLRSEPGVEVRVFNYSRFPSFLRAENGTRFAGEYAWKAPIVYEVAHEANVRRVLWLDAGTRIPDAAGAFRRLSPTAGLLSTPTNGPIHRYVHKGMQRHFHAEALEQAMTTLCNGAFVGFDTRSDEAMAALRGWRECSLDVECIAPSGSHRGNHRQDQAALTVLAWLHGLHATCTRQVVPLLTHVEAMQVRCAGDGGVGDGGGALEFGVAALVVALVCLACCGCWRGSECVERWVQGLPL